ncbi:MAG: hypothetical protein ACLTA7_09015 [Ruminococcus sp.]
MTKKEFVELVLVNDVSFQYKGKEYYIFQGNNSCICGEYGKENIEIIFDKDPIIYKNIEDMLEHWMIDGEPLKKRIGKIHFEGN